MKKFYLLLSLCSIAAVASARPISESEAEAIAATKLPGLERNFVRVRANVDATQSATPPVYMFNSPKGGFAIVSGNDEMPNMLLAYSEVGSLNLDDCPPAFMAWLDEMSAFIAAGDFSNVSRSTLNYSTPVAPMIATKWDQTDPYDLLTPLGSTGKHCPTGCVATAMAQVVNFWQYPVDGGLCEHSYTWNGETLSVDFRTVRYDWANMADVYNSSSTTAQRDAVAKLMYDCGVACNMNYGDDESGSNDYLCANAMVDIFGYSSETRLCMRLAYEDDEWFELVKSELDAGRPLIYMGTTPSNEGHAFVCDGYDTEGLYHINWGWSGKCDGYFDLNTLDPEEQGTGGAASGEGFSMDQSVLANCRPPQADDVAANGWELGVYNFYLIPTDTEGSTFNIKPMFMNLGFRNYTGEIGLYIHPADEAIDEEEEPDILCQFTSTNPLEPGAIIGMEICDIDASSMPDGTWQIDFVAIPESDPNTETQLTVLTSSNPTQLEIKNGKLVFSTSPKLAISNYQIEPIDYFFPSADGVRCVFAKLSFDVTNNSGITYTNGFSCSVEYENGVFMPSSKVTFSDYTTDPLEAGETVNIEHLIYFRVDAEASLEITECEKTGSPSQNAVFSDNSLTFNNSLVYHELAFESEPVATVNSDHVTITADILSTLGEPLSQELNEDYEMTREITCDIYDNATNTVVASATATYTGTWQEAKELTFEPATALESGDYTAKFYYTSASYGMGTTDTLEIGAEDNYAGLAFSITSSAIININCEDNTDGAVEIYTLTGIRVDNPATLAPGIYLRRQGKTVTKLYLAK